MLNGESDKSFVDDLVASRYCKCESSLCCYEALRFILCFYDLFFLVFKKSYGKLACGAVGVKRSPSWTGMQTVFSQLS